MTGSEPLDTQELAAAAQRIRTKCLELGHNAGPQGAHFGPALSLVEIFTALYGRLLDLSPDSRDQPNRDRVILSKGHGSLALYATLHEFGFIPTEIVDMCETDGSPLPGQPVRDHKFGIEFSSGSLGMGLSFGIGLALSARMQQSQRKVVVVMGDGETNEGSVWEAAMLATHQKLDNVTAIVDVNDLQSDGATNEILAMDHAAMWGGFGWDTVSVDGHDLRALVGAFEAPRTGRPRVLLAKTVKGKGVSFMEHDPEWHHGRLSDEQAAQALDETSAGGLV